MSNISNGWATGTRDCVTAAFARSLAAVPDSVFLDFSGESYTYAHFDRLSSHLASSFLKLGVQPGERVASMLDNSVQAVATWIAANKIGAIWVPINTANKGEFLRHPLADCGAKLVVVDAQYFERIAMVADGIPDMSLVLVNGEYPETAATPFAVQALSDHWGESATVEVVENSPSDIGALMYTSGTTGPSKACMMSHNYLCNIARAGSNLVALESHDIVWTPLPLFHTSGLQAILGAIIVGGKVSISLKFSASNFWAEIETSGATVAKIMASMVPILIAAPEDEAMKRTFGQVRAVVGNPFTPAQKQAFYERFGVKYIANNQYGSTEVYCGTSVPYLADTPQGSAGKRNDDFDVIVLDDHDCEVPYGTPGELCFRPSKPDVMFSGYWQQPEKSAEVWRNLWMHTGDMVRMDEEGYIYFTDRKKDYMRKGGENISGFEMEKTFMVHDAIGEVSVHALPSELGEDDIKVVVVLAEGASLTHEELWHWSRERVPSFATPRYVEFRKELPKNGVGRVLKYQLRDEGVTPATWDVQTTDLVKKRVTK